MSLLQADYFAIRTILFGVRKVAEQRLAGGKSRHDLKMSKEKKYALDDFCGASDSLASRFQFPRGWRSYPLAAGGSVGGLGN